MHLDDLRTGKRQMAQTKKGTRGSIKERQAEERQADTRETLTLLTLRLFTAEHQCQR